MRVKQQDISRDEGMNGAVLKWIAIASMFIDHFGATILLFVDLPIAADWGTIYYYCRQIGRLAFPIFAFLTVQGYQHTSKLEKYIGNLFIFALISEVPFDLAFYDTSYYGGHMNIFFTLALGIIGLALYENFEEKNQLVPQLLTLVLTGWIAEILRVDYGFYGVALIMGLGILRNNKTTQTVFGVIMGLLQTPAASLAFFPITLYNGERGRQNKWFFYIFYPAHLLVFYLIRTLFF